MAIKNDTQLGITKDCIRDYKMKIEILKLEIAEMEEQIVKMQKNVEKYESKEKK